jgi:hypothetical protein
MEILQETPWKIAENRTVKAGSSPPSIGPADPAEAIAVSAVHALARLEVKAGARIRACPSPELRLQDCGQPSRARARGRDFGSNLVAQPHTVKAATVMNNVFDCLQIDRGMPADLDKRIAT